MGDQVRRTFISPIVGTGKQGDLRRPLASLYARRTSWVMHELSDHEHCIVTFFGDSDEIAKCLADTEIHEAPVDFRKTLNLELPSRLAGEVRALLRVAEKDSLHMRGKRVGKT